MQKWIDIAPSIASIASAVAAIASVVIAIMFGCLQRRQECNAQRIALFDKRYDIYQTFVDIFEIMQFALIKDDATTVPNYLVVADMVLESHELMKDKHFLTEHLRLNRIAQTGNKEDRECADRDLFYLDWYAHNQLLQLRSKTISKIKPAKFCFDEGLHDVLKNTIQEFFDYILIFKTGSAKEQDRDPHALRTYLEEIDRKKILEKMETYLEII